MWLRFGQQVRYHREQAGLSQGQLAKALTIQPAMLSAIERGVRGAKPDYAHQIDKALSTGGKLSRLLDSLTTNNGAPNWFRDVLTLEKQAATIREYDPILIPGLLQTENYARTILRDGRPQNSDAEVEELVAARMRRKKILGGERPPRLLVVLDEMVIRRPVGGAEIMKAQLGGLLDVTSNSHVVLQLVPFQTARNPGLSGAFRLLDGPEIGEILYLETVIGGSPIDDPNHVALCSHMFGDLRGVAFPPDQSRRLIESVIQGGF
ncbi:helix-turn-helix protein [Actinorugispora endophytica]|uniref:Helix-turn-helix protein n=2 Tax=Actinorugispora endophytica TaxID=1605990 RepID=A0A4R6V9K6_9ACTN|nr:helix-turn-helix protein [Actinorugispora endophytica]